MNTLRIIGPCILAVAGWAQATPQVYQGHVGNAPVVMEFEIAQDGHVEGRYFYRKYHNDIVLSGKKMEDGHLRLGENLPYDSERTDIVIKPQGKAWVGEWKGPKATAALPMQLAPLDTDALKPLDPAIAGWKTRAPYDYARLSGLLFKPGKTQKFNGYNLQWMEEPVSKVKLFRVQDGLPADVLTRLNRTLAERQWREVDSYFNCMGGAARSASGSYEQTVTPRFINSRFLSISLFTQYDCGGAHPDFADTPLNLDLKNGKELQLEALLWLGKGSAKLARKPDGSRVNYQYEEKVLAPWLQRTMKPRYPKNKASGPDGCDYNDASVWQFVTWYLTPQGLYISPSFPRAARACEYPEWSILPWKVVNQHPGSLGGGLP